MLTIHIIIRKPFVDQMICQDDRIIPSALLDYTRKHAFLLRLYIDEKIFADNGTQKVDTLAVVSCCSF